MSNVALGFRAHSGWAAMVAAAPSVVLHRRVIVTADAAIPGSKQPFHAAEGLTMPDAEALIARCRESSAGLAAKAVTDFIAELERAGHRVVGAGVLFASGRPLPDRAAILKSHALIHTAEGEFFRDVLVRACGECRVPVTKIREREVRERAEAALGLSSGDLERLVAELGRTLGPPWREDEKLASLAGWVALAAST